MPLKTLPSASTNLPSKFERFLLIVHYKEPHNCSSASVREGSSSRRQYVRVVCFRQCASKTKGEQKRVSFLWCWAFTAFKEKPNITQTIDFLNFKAESFLCLCLLNVFVCVFLCGCEVLISVFSLISSLCYSPGKLDSPTHWPHGPPWKTKSLWVAKCICHTDQHTHTHTQ